MNWPRSAAPWNGNARRVQGQPKKWTREQRDAGLDKACAPALRRSSIRGASRSATIRRTCSALSKLLDLEPADFDRRHFTPADLIPKRAMGDPNSVYDLQNYIVGPAPSGPLDFERINYPKLLSGLSVRNNVQPGVSSRPVDFIAMRIPDHRSLALCRRRSSGADPVTPGRATLSGDPRFAPGRRRRHSL